MLELALAALAAGIAAAGSFGRQQAIEASAVRTVLNAVLPSVGATWKPVDGDHPWSAATVVPSSYPIDRRPPQFSI